MAGPSIGVNQSRAPVQGHEEYNLDTVRELHGHTPRPANDNRLSRLLDSLKSTGKQLYNDSKSQLPTKEVAGAMAGHALQQMITCGGTTFAREEAFIHAFQGMLPLLEGNAKYALLVPQAAISLASFAMHQNRAKRLEEFAHSNVNVRGHFGLGEAEWNAKSDVEKLELRNQHQTDSRNVTRNQVLAEAGWFVLSSADLALGDGSRAARALSTQLRNVVYAASRETLQATIGLTASKEGKSTNGVNASHMAANGWTYTAMTLAMGELQDIATRALLPAGQSVAGPALTNAQGQPLKGQELANAAHLVAGIRAVANTAIEFMDANRGKHYDTKQVGDTQTFQTDVTKMLPRKDYERLGDHSPIRFQWNQSANLLTYLTSLSAEAAAHGKLSPEASSLIANLASATAFGALYAPTNQSYQAAAKNRAARAAAGAPSNQVHVAESGAGVILGATKKEARSTTGANLLTRAGRVGESSRMGALGNMGASSQVTRPGVAPVQGESSLGALSRARQSQIMGPRIQELPDDAPEDYSREAIRLGKQPMRRTTDSEPATDRRTVTGNSSTRPAPPPATATTSNTPAPATATTSNAPPPATATTSNTPAPATATTSSAPAPAAATTSSTPAPATATTSTTSPAPATATATPTLAEIPSGAFIDDELKRLMG